MQSTLYQEDNDGQEIEAETSSPVDNTSTQSIVETETMSCNDDDGGGKMPSVENEQPTKEHDGASTTCDCDSNDNRPSSSFSQGGHFASLSTEQVQQLLGAELKALTEPWHGSIPFKAYVVMEKDMDDISALFNVPPQEINMCDYLNGGRFPTVQLRFCPKAYPPPSSNEQMKGKETCPGWEDLKRDICISAHEAGNPVKSNGSSTGKSSDRVFKCSGNDRHTKSRAMEVMGDNQYRKTSLVNNDKSNRRPKGKTKPRKAQAISKEEGDIICPFRFAINWDVHSFFISLTRKAGMPEHRGHARPFDPSVIPFPTRLLTADQVKDTQHVVESACNKAAGRNFARSKFLRFINTLKIAYLDRKAGGGSLTANDDIANMIEGFKSSNEIMFSTLSDARPTDFDDDCSEMDGDTSSVGTARKDGNTGSDGTITVSTLKNDNGDVVNTPVSTIPELAPIEAIAKQERQERSLFDTEMLFISIAWLVLPMFRLFKLCPEVIWCDVTSHSNNKGFNLLTFSCRTSVDMQAVFLWIWIPNQQRYSFRWVFQHAIPNLIPKWLRERVLLIMKDGDAQQRNEILRALFRVFPNAKEAGCGFHIGK